jgi:hypothetical protein
VHVVSSGRQNEERVHKKDPRICLPVANCSQWLSSVVVVISERINLYRSESKSLQFTQPALVRDNTIVRNVGSYRSPSRLRPCDTCQNKALVTSTSALSRQECSLDDSRTCIAQTRDQVQKHVLYLVTSKIPVASPGWDFHNSLTVEPNLPLICQPFLIEWHTVAVTSTNIH